MWRASAGGPCRARRRADDAPAFRFGPALLFCPADRPDRYAKAADRADAVILDLEDAVARRREGAPRGTRCRDPARPRARDRPRQPGRRGRVRGRPRERSPQTPYRTVMLAKSEGTADLVGARRFRGRRPLRDRSRRARSRRSPPADVSALMWGAEDLVASLGGSSSRHDDGRYRDVARYASPHVLLAAGAHGKAAIDAVHLDIGDLDGLRDEADDAAASGFAATACIHPAQVAVVREAYRPERRRLAWAQRCSRRRRSRPGCSVPRRDGRRARARGRPKRSCAERGDAGRGIRPSFEGLNTRAARNIR